MYNRIHATSNAIMNDGTTYTVCFYILVIILIIIAKPSFLFDEHGEARPFGVGDDKSIISLGVVVVALSIMSFYIFACIDVVFASRTC